MIKSVREVNLNEKRVFLRLDLNVPIKDGIILDDYRIKRAIPTIEFLLKNNASVMVASHLGRPKKNDFRYSLSPVAEYLATKMNIEVVMIDNCASDAPKALIKQAKANKILMLENLRFNSGEMENSISLASHWASYIDVYINDAFGVSHRKHASIDAICSIVDTKAMGLLFENEIEMLDTIKNPQEPFLVLLGGSKVVDKIKILKNLVDKIDIALLGGVLAFTFLEASGFKTYGKREGISLAKEVIQAFKARDKLLLLPIDHVEAININDISSVKVSKNISEGYRGLDIGPETIKLYSRHIDKACTIFANGPVGMFEVNDFSNGTVSLLNSISKSNAFSVAGGGDLAHAAVKNNIDINLSTGGGAGLEYLVKGKLSGLSALEIEV